jgi:molybdopterin molybdotransferase
MTRLTPAEAEALILDHMPRFASCEEPIDDCLGRVLAADVVTDRDQPPFDRVTMDGIAVAYRDWDSGKRSFEVVGTQAAGAPALTAEAGQCVEVMTGTLLPAGTDTVIPVERVERRGGMAAVAASATVTARQYVHHRASDRAAGSVVLTAGTRIGAPEMAVLASAGRATVAVAALPRIAVISTGDELVDVGAPLAPYQIRSTNDRALAAALTRERLAVVTRARLPDDGAALAEAITRLDAGADALVLSGGVSMGQFDLVPGVLQSLGAKLVFHRVLQRPGKPMWFGLSARFKPIFALPGNPVSTLVCAARYIVPALRAASGEPPRAPELVALAAPFEASPELTYFMPVKVSSSPAGVTLATPRPTNTSGDYVALAGTHGFEELPPRRGEHPAGTVARLYRW